MPLRILLLLLLFVHELQAQTATDVLSGIFQAQQRIKTFKTYVTRHDTLVTGHVRTLKGWVNISSDPQDSIFGFRFFAQPDSINGVSLYDGQYSYFIDHASREYTRYSRPEMLDAIQGFPGGQLIYKDLIRLDTGQATGYRLRTDADYYYLTILLQDISLYKVINRSKELTITRKDFLPVAARYHQETLGKVQDLYFNCSQWVLNDPATAYDFSLQRYPEDYQTAEKGTDPRLRQLLGKPIPAFTVRDFGGQLIQPAAGNGQLLLLDFWEVWCGPCVGAMPKLKTLYEKYHSKGFDIIGIIHQTEHQAAALQLIQQFKPGFRMAVGNEQTKSLFHVGAVPLYVLIDKRGTIILVQEGYPDQLEELIQQHL